MWERQKKEKTTELYILNRDSHWDTTLNKYKSWKCSLFHTFPLFARMKKKTHFYGFVSMYFILFPDPYKTQDPCAVVTCMSCHWSVLTYKPTKTTNQMPSSFWQSLREKLNWMPDPENILFVLVEHRRQDDDRSTLAAPRNKIWARISQLAFNLTAKLLPQGWSRHSRAGL